ncbi:V-set domain-containing T-cell activation inhibitor 1-like isoform X1 [Rhincodon typus]|uniref:V-set domain-containing T-cell activation inhibitor 1-like isoform X1 n=2 Tax=Rhincodon typus TaxID=259920 RepID=UPI00202F593D|nr:V-set domain-containing T-cell activation inhibitor 1-like isoform X1 [Rhincodon typus]
MREHERPASRMSHLFVSLVAFIIKLAAAQGFSDGDLKIECVKNQITVKFGEDLVIRCCHHFVDEPSAITFSWMKMETMGVIYNYTMSHSSLEEQEPSYRDRVKVFDNEIPKGNVSLRLRNVTLSDSGIYRLSVATRSQSTETMVAVGVRAVGAQPVIRSYVTDQGFSKLVCESSGWFPEPTVIWENSLGVQLTQYAHTETINGTGGFLHMRSTIGLDHGPISNYTCTMMDRHLNEAVSFVFVVLSEYCILKLCLPPCEDPLATAVKTTPSHRLYIACQFPL